MKKIIIVLTVFNALNMYSMDNKEHKPLRNSKVMHSGPQKKIPTTEEFKTLVTKKKELEHLKDWKNSNYPIYPLPKKKTLSAQEVEIVAAQKKAADATQLKKELCVCFGCYVCASSAAVASYHAGAYALGQLKNAATNYWISSDSK